MSQSTGIAEMHGIKWSDKLALYCGVFFCVCGYIALVLDLLSGSVFGEPDFVQGSTALVARWLFPVGLVSSLVALAGRPTRLKWRVVAAFLTIMFALGSLFVWTPVVLNTGSNDLPPGPPPPPAEVGSALFDSGVPLQEGANRQPQPDQKPPKPVVAGISATQPQAAKSAAANSGKTPSSDQMYYGRKMPQAYRDRTEIVAFVERKLYPATSIVFCQPHWCLAMVDHGSGAHVWTALFFERNDTLSSNSNGDLKDPLPWKLRRIYEGVTSAGQLEDGPMSAYLDHKSRTLILQDRTGRKLATLLVPK